MAAICRLVVPLERLILVNLEAKLAVLAGLFESVLRIGVASIRRFARLKLDIRPLAVPLEWQSKQTRAKQKQNFKKKKLQRTGFARPPGPRY